MEIKVDGKSFGFEVQGGCVIVREFYKSRQRWIKIPSNLLCWLCDALCLCSELQENVYQKRVGFITWSVVTKSNQWGWFLELSVNFRGSKFCICVPSCSTRDPWKLFTDSFIEIVHFRSDDENVSLPSSYENAWNLITFENESLNDQRSEGFLKHMVDASLQFENELSGSLVVMSGDSVKPQYLEQDADNVFVNDNGTDCAEMVSSSLSSCFSKASHLLHHEFCLSTSRIDGHGVDRVVDEGSHVKVKPIKGFEISGRDAEFSVFGSFNSGTSVSLDAIKEMMEEASQIRSMNLSNSFCVDVVDSFPCSGKVRKKKKKPSKVAFVSFSKGDTIDESENGDKENVEPLRGDNENWEPDKRGKEDVEARFISCMDKEWVSHSLGLPLDATSKEISQRMYELQREGKIDVDVRVLRILDGLSNIYKGP